MNIRLSTLVVSSAAAIAALSIHPAQAATGSTNFDVSIQVNATCAISASNMAFGSITTGTTSNSDATSTLTVNCSNGTPYTISLGNGANFSNVRRMAWGGSYIEYSLFQDNSRTTQWSLTQTKSGTGNGADQSITVYGRVPSGQVITNTGSYGDTVVATITY
ncbi:MAG: spore coat protein U domain-containing protein [Burkholderiaceae bacterium]|nr:spore coat protein U domain-containing protein [Burkholderiaceae bacterium]